jgi:hypothetical protein
MKNLALLLLLPVLLTTAHAQKPITPCALITPTQIKTLLTTPVASGKPGDSDCTWADAKGATRVYLQIKDVTPDYKSFRDSMQATGKLVPVTGLSSDAFYISSTGSSAALYFLEGKHLVLLTVDGINFSRAENEAAERAIATTILPKLK